MALCLGLPGSAGTRKVKPIWISLKQERVSGSSISWAICKSAPCSRQITTPAPHHSVFYRLDALSATKPIASKHWRQWAITSSSIIHTQLDSKATKHRQLPNCLGCKSAKNWRLPSTSTIAIVIITQPVSWYHFTIPHKHLDTKSQRES